MSITETVSQWLANEEGTVAYLEGSAVECLKDAIDSGETHIRSIKLDTEDRMSEVIKDLVYKTMPSAQGMWQAILDDAMREIDFDELGTEYVADLKVYSISSPDFEDDDGAFVSLEDACQALYNKLGTEDEDGELADQVLALQPGQTIKLYGHDWLLQVHQ